MSAEIDVAGWLKKEWAAHHGAVEAMQAMLPQVGRIADELIRRYTEGGVLYTFGNGGSAADAQHLAAEMIGRYRRERRPLPAVALSTDPSTVTCIANDYGYDEVFARQVRALIRPGDIVVGFSTSGLSPTVVKGLEAAREVGAWTVLCTGERGAGLVDLVDDALVVPAVETARVQEMHVLVLHLISDVVDRWAAATPPDGHPR